MSKKELFLLTFLWSSLLIFFAWSMIWKGDMIDNERRNERIRQDSIMAAQIHIQDSISRHVTDSIRNDLNNLMEWTFKSRDFKTNGLIEELRYKNTGKDIHRRQANAFYDSCNKYTGMVRELSERVLKAKNKGDE